MVTYDSRQWEKCKWDLSNLSDKLSCLEKFPELREKFAKIETAYYKGASNSEDEKLKLVTHNDIPFEKIVRYVILVYHRYSPYAIHQQDIIARKFDVCEFIGLNPKGAAVKKMIANQFEFINSTALFFLKHESNMVWLELQTYLEAYYQIMGALVDGREDTSSKGVVDNAKTKLAVVKDVKNIKSEIDSLSAQIFGGDNNLLNYVERYKEDEATEFSIYSPEMFVQKMARKSVEA